MSKDVAMIVDEKTLRRFWSKVDIRSDDECWEWTGTVSAGTGRFNPYKTGLSAQAHRTAFLLTQGEIPSDKRVRHSCHNPICCNPNHLVLSSDVEDRFWSKVNKTPGLGVGDCWLWTGRITDVGYGQFAESHRSSVSAHRFALQLSTGLLQPESVFACHSCDVRACVNPAHLFWGTSEDNQRDMTRKGRHRWGENNGQAVLTEEQVIEIKQLLADEQFSQAAIGEMYGVCQTTISRIKLGQSWNPEELIPKRERRKHRDDSI